MTIELTKLVLGLIKSIIKHKLSPSSILLLETKQKWTLSLYRHSLMEGQLYMSLKCPLVLLPNLWFFFWIVIILDVECLTSLLWSLSLHHVYHILASQFQYPLNVQIVGHLKIGTIGTPIHQVRQRRLWYCLINEWTKMKLVNTRSYKGHAHHKYQKILKQKLHHNI